MLPDADNNTTTTYKGKAINYRSLGTVEFIVDAETHDFYFLEVNTRLQVRRPFFCVSNLTLHPLVSNFPLCAGGAPSHRSYFRPRLG